MKESEPGPARVPFVRSEPSFPYGKDERPLRVISLNGRVDHLVREELPCGVITTLCGAILRGNLPMQPKPVFRTCKGCLAEQKARASRVV